MKNTTFRKKALLSSVAMLLVALVALGSATFAWFTSSTTASTSGLTVHTSKASKLQISKATGEWGTTVNYATGDLLLLPASTANGSNWFTASATKSDSYAATTYTTASNTQNQNYYFADQLNVKNGATDGAGITNVQIKMTWPSEASDTSYLRVALVEAKERGNNKGFATGAAFTDNIFAKDATIYYPIQSDGSVSTTGITPKAGPTTNTTIITLKDAEGNNLVLTSGKEVYYNLYVWFEGQDTDCKDENAGATIPDVKFEVTGDTVVG